MKTIRLMLALMAVTLFSFAAAAQTLQPALTAYYGVKDALVSTNAAKAKTAASALLTALGKVDAAKLSPADRQALATAKTKTTAIAKTTDVATQRSAFEVLSTSMIALAKSAKPGKTYVQFCPMAAEGKGASWLSNKKEVRNPYYGDKMLTCGKVTAEI